MEKSHPYLAHGLELKELALPRGKRARSTSLIRISSRGLCILYLTLLPPEVTEYHHDNLLSGLQVCPDIDLSYLIEREDMY